MAHVPYGMAYAPMRHCLCMFFHAASRQTANKKMRVHQSLSANGDPHRCLSLMTELLSSLSLCSACGTSHTNSAYNDFLRSDDLKTIV